MTRSLSRASHINSTVPNLFNLFKHHLFPLDISILCNSNARSVIKSKTIKIFFVNSE